MAKAKAEITISHMIDIVSINRYYLLQSSTANPPGKPTTNPPPSTWSLTEPAYTAGSTNTLYTVELTIFTNGTFKYSEVSKSSSYEAAKQAYNKAVGVENRVVEAETSIQQNRDAIELKASKTEVANIRVGAKNLAEKTNNGALGWTWSMQTGGATILPYLENGVNCCKMIRNDVASGSWSAIMYRFACPDKYELDTEYTISFEVKPSVEAAFYARLNNDGSTSPLSNSGGPISVTPGKWNRVEVVVKTVAIEPPTRDQRVFLYGMTSTPSITYIFKNLKVEKGNKATDWTPAPEDVIADIDKIYMGARNLAEKTNQGMEGWNWAMETGTTFITSAKIDDIYCCEMTRNNDEAGSYSYIYYDKIMPKKYDADAEYIISFDVKPTLSTSLTVAMMNTDGTNVIVNTSDPIDIGSGRWNKVQILVKTNMSFTANNQVLYLSGMNSTYLAMYTFRNLKIEKGNKATDWTPAPEDIDDKIDNKSDEIYNVITEQTTSIKQTCEEIVLDAVKEYTKTGDFESFKETISSQLSLMADNMTLQFTQTTQNLNNINTDLNDKFNTITKYFTFNIDGLTIGQVDNPYKVIINNDRYSMTANDVEVMWIANGHVYTPELSISRKLNMFGYEFEPDASGNVNLSYVGG